MVVRPPINRAEHRLAMARLIDRAGSADPQSEQRVDMLEMYACKRGLSLDHCLLIADQDRIEGVCLALDSPGRTSSLLLSPGITQMRLRQSAGELLRAAQAGAAGRGVQLLQAMVPPECAEEAVLYAATGMKHLANLIYMQCDLRRDLPRATGRVLQWESYSRATHDMFARVIEQTYEDSLDCGSLNGVRHIEDILASHKATGEFDPQLWRVGLDDGEPVGVILLGYMDEQQAYELIYMGCTAARRRRGYGTCLLEHGIGLVLSRAVSSMCVSVDEKNAPARKLYETFGFREVTRRGVWIRVFPLAGEFKR